MEKGNDHTICDKLPAVKLDDQDSNVDMDLLKSNNDTTTTTTTTDKLKTKYDALGDDDDKCVNNQDICNNRKNVKTSNKSDCNVVIDDSLQQTEQQQQPDESQEFSPPSSHQQKSHQPKQKQPSTYGCVHYKRKAKFVTPCCGRFYNCRYCHDENEDHHFDRKTLTELICTNCDTRQKVQAECEKCGVRFGKYTCLICNLFDDEDKDQYHCNGCGICRIGGRNNFFHCEVCNMCLPLQLKTNGHRCVENISRSNCPVCLGDIHTSRFPCHIPDCGHLLHKTFFDQLLASGHYVCPTCQTSMIDMSKLWNYFDTQAQNLPVPKSHENSIVDIFHGSLETSLNGN